MCKSNRVIVFFISLLISALPAVVMAFSPAQQPLCLSGKNKPMTMLLMGRDHTLFYDAYNDTLDLDGDHSLDIGFSPTVTYFGYFDSRRCYQYDQSKQFFHSGLKVNGNANCAGTGWPWSGNFLNYVTMTRVDVLRKVLYGGKRDIDSATETVLQRAVIPKESHAWAKQFPAPGQALAEVSFDIGDYADVGSNPSVAGTYHLFASVEDELWIWKNANHEAAAWASQERNHPGVLSPEPAAADKLKVRVKVCAELDTKCQAYTGVNKPVGVLQEVGIDKSMKFGLISGSYDQNLQGGVLRKNVSDFSDEIDADTGQFLKPKTGNIVDNIDKFTINGFDAAKNEYSCGWKIDKPGSGGMVDGECEDWGNPIGEMLYESMRYFSGAAAATPTFITSTARDKNELKLSTGVEWKDPFYPDNKLDACLRPFNLVISDLYPTYDGDSIPGSSSSSFSATDITATAPSMSSQLATITSQEGLGGKNYFYGRKEGAAAGSDEAKSEYNPTSKSLTNLEEIRGLAPFNASEEGSYSSAAMAYWGRITDLRPAGKSNEVEGEQTVQTLVVALASPLPEFNFDFDGKKVSIIPFGKSPKGHGIDPSESAYQPTNALLDFYILEQIKGVPTKIAVTFDDVTQGGDQDLDVRVDYHFYTDDDNGKEVATPDPFDDAEATETLNIAANQLRIDTIVRYSGSDSITQHLGYIIDGTSSLATDISSSTVTCDEADFFEPPEPVVLEVDGNRLAVDPVCIAGEHNSWDPSDALTWDKTSRKWYKYAVFENEQLFKIVPNCTWDGQEYPDDKWKIWAGSGCYKVSVTKNNRSAADIKVNKDFSNADCSDPNPPAAAEVSVATGSYVFHDTGSDTYYLMPPSEADGNIRVVYLDQDISNFNIKLVEGGKLKQVSSDKLKTHQDQRSGDLTADTSKIYAYQFKANYGSSNVAIVKIDLGSKDIPVVDGYDGAPVSDGIYLEVTDQKLAGFHSNHSPAVSYYLDTHQGEYSYPDNRRYLCGTDNGGLLKAWNSRTFNIDPASSTGSASILKSPLWYAAKWGSFEDSNNNNKPDLTSEWQDPKTGEPASFWLVTNATNLGQQLTDAFKAIVSKVRSSETLLVVNSGSIRNNSLIYTASYNSEFWSGDIEAFTASKEANTITIGDELTGNTWSAKKVIAAQFNTDEKVDKRRIFTSKSDGSASVFTAEAMKADIATVSGRDAAALINYVRGSTENEGLGNYRVRTEKAKDAETGTPYVLGDVVHSSPAFSGKPSYFLDDAGYEDYYKTFSARTPVLVFGANDGMVHVINAKKDVAQGGRELFAYVPSQMYRQVDGETYLAKLADPDYLDAHQYYVDGPIKLVDVYGNRGSGDAWHTLAVGSLGGGGKGYYALDISDPDPTGGDALTGNNNRFVGSQTTPVLWERTDMGHVYGQIEFGKLTIAAKPQWVGLLPNGYGDATSPTLHVVNMMTGKDHFTLDTAKASNAAACSSSGDNGLSSVSALIEDGFIQYAYAGDLKGNMWRFDFTKDKPSVSCLSQAKDPDDLAQPITVAPAIGNGPSQVDGYMVYFGTGKFIESSDLSSRQVQSFYGVLDDHSGKLVDPNTIEQLEITYDSSVGRSITGDSPDYTSTTSPARGFYLNLPTSGERVLTKASIIENILFVATQWPEVSCESSGCPGWLMALNLISGQSSTRFSHQEYEDFVVPPIPLIADEYILLPNAGTPKDAGAPSTNKDNADCENASIINHAEGVNLAGALCINKGRKSWRHIY